MENEKPIKDSFTITDGSEDQKIWTIPKGDAIQSQSARYGYGSDGSFIMSLMSPFSGEIAFRTIEPETLKTIRDACQTCLDILNAEKPIE